MQDTAGSLTYFGTVIHLYRDLLDKDKGLPCLLTECYSLQYNQNYIRLQNFEKRKKNIFISNFFKLHVNYMGYSSICSKFHEKIRMPNLNLPSNSQCLHFDEHKHIKE